MKAAKWIKEIEKAKKKLYEYRREGQCYCVMPFTFMEAVMTKLMKSIPISWIENEIKEHESISTDKAFCSSLRILINLWEKENGIVCDSGVPDLDRSGTADSGTAELPE